jgi:hypothetical protein
LIRRSASATASISALPENLGARWLTFVQTAIWGKSIGLKSSPEIVALRLDCLNLRIRQTN